MMTSAYAGLRYAPQAVPPGAVAAGAGRLHIPATTYNQVPENFVRIARSPIPTPTDEPEPVATPNTLFPYPQQPLSQEACYRQFTDPRFSGQPVAPPHYNQQQQHHFQQLYHPSAPQAPPPPPSSQTTHQAQGHNRSYPPQYVMHGQYRYDCIPPPGPVQVQYSVPLEGVAYSGHHAQDHYHEVLTLNTPIGAAMENLLPGVPPPPTGSPSADVGAPADTSNDHCHQPDGTTCHKLPGTSPQHPPSCDLMSESAAVAYVSGSSKDVLCGQSGN